MKNLIIAGMLFTAFACRANDLIDIAKFSPPIVASTVSPDAGWNITGHMSRLGMAPFAPLVDSYNHSGQLIASWNPGVDIHQRATIIVMHGGHGVASGNLETANWLRKAYDANVLILDSYWSRGRHENWATYTPYGVNMRVLDALAAARFTKAQGADPKKTFIYGDSQGGWTVLRTFSGHNLAPEVKSLLAGGVALYPNCYEQENVWGTGPYKVRDRELAPPLGALQQPVAVFSGSADTATPTNVCNLEKSLKTAEKWIEFEGATHAWDQPTQGAGMPSIDGVCTTAANIYNPFRMCRSNDYTAQMRATVEQFLIDKGALNQEDVTARKLARLQEAKKPMQHYTFVPKQQTEADQEAATKKIMEAVGIK